MAVRSDFPDSLAGGAHVARLGGPMLLSGSDALHPATGDFLCDHPDIAQVILYGGQAVLDTTVRSDVNARLSGC